MESHARDLEQYVSVARNKRRRAKALLDFERHDDDELGFRKNDIITVSIIYKNGFIFSLQNLHGFKGLPTKRPWFGVSKFSLYCMFFYLSVQVFFSHRLYHRRMNTVGLES